MRTFFVVAKARFFYCKPSIVAIKTKRKDSLMVIFRWKTIHKKLLFIPFLWDTERMSLFSSNVQTRRLLKNFMNKLIFIAGLFEQDVESWFFKIWDFQFHFLTLEENLFSKWSKKQSIKKFQICWASLTDLSRSIFRMAKYVQSVLIDQGQQSRFCVSESDNWTASFDRLSELFGTSSLTTVYNHDNWNSLTALCYVQTGE